MLRDIYRKYYIWKNGKRYRRDMKRYTELNTNINFCIDKHFLYPILSEWKESAGELGPYFWQDTWAAKRIFTEKPEKHYDIGSRIDGFIGMISLFIKDIVLIDIRPLGYNIENVSFICADATSLEGIESNSVKSLSALCSLEHFGLGRYGDSIDPDGCFKAFKSIQRVISKGGRIYISVPIGKEHLEFNAHRIFYASTIVNAFDEMKLIEYSVTPIAGEKEMLYNCDIHRFDNEGDNKGERFGCFIFEKEG